MHQHGSAWLSVHSRHAIAVGYSSRDGASARLPGRLRCPGRRPPSGWPGTGRGVRQGCKTARRDPTESPVGYPSASYARSSCCVGSAWGATGSPERCISRARRSTGFFAGLACSGSRVLNPYPIRTATSGLTPVICCSTWTPRSWAAHGHHLSGTPAGGQKTCPARGGMEHRKTCVLDAVLRARSGHSRDRLPPGSVQRRWSEGYFSSGGGRESNPPASFRPPTDFEGMSDACA